jgi:preprotein translocase subunit SecG
MIQAAPGYYDGPPAMQSMPSCGAPQAPPQKHSTNGLAIASMVLGIVWIGSILALVFGYMAKKQIEESSGRETRAGMATAGIALGWVGVGFLALLILIGLIHGYNSRSG